MRPSKGFLKHQDKQRDFANASSTSRFTRRRKRTADRKRKTIVYRFFVFTKKDISNLKTLFTFLKTKYTDKFKLNNYTDTIDMKYVFKHTPKQTRNEDIVENMLLVTIKVDYHISFTIKNEIVGGSIFIVSSDYELYNRWTTEGIHIGNELFMPVRQEYYNRIIRRCYEYLSKNTRRIR